MIGEWGNVYEVLVEREGLLGCMFMGVGFFEKVWVDLEIWDFGLVMNEGKFFEFFLLVVYVVVGFIKFVKFCFFFFFIY